MLAADTWSISAPRFLVVYALAVAVALAVALGLRAAAFRGGHPGRRPAALEVAYLNGGPARAVHAAVAGLRAAGAVGIGSPRALAATGPIPPGATRLDHAVYAAADRHRPEAGRRVVASVRRTNPHPRGHWRRRW